MKLRSELVSEEKNKKQIDKIEIKDRITKTGGKEKDVERIKNERKVKEQ